MCYNTQKENYMALADLINQETVALPPSESPQAIQGTGGGLADLVPAQIDSEQPAALSEGEFVWPADVVSMLGDGSTDAGARILNNLMTKIRDVKSQQGDKQAGSIADLLK